MKKGLLALVAVVALGSSMAWAGCGSKEHKGPMCDEPRGQMCDGESPMMHDGMPHREMMPVRMALDAVKLRPEQNEKIEAAVETFRKSSMGAMEAFGKDKFDKNAYIEARKNKKERMIEASATLFETIYSVLDKEQKEQFHAALQKVGPNKFKVCKAKARE
ncbi:MAG: hypothetical protein KU37_02770 [Sulfuricurvum sp. PC08-66]|nr:MAG: hypothetical protein KU37_02770 [Sulfuricurvum sp. PC08-66]